MKDYAPSRTAQVIAASLFLLAREKHSRNFVPHDVAALNHQFVRACSKRAARALNAATSPCGQAIISFLESHLLPGIRLNYALRKLYLEEVAREALAQGYRQIVVLGAGFDTLALRLCTEFPAARFVEVDHPATQRVKLQVVASHLTREDNLKFLSLDFRRESLRAALARSGIYDTQAKTLFIAEGLLMYLSANQARSIFASLRRQSAPLCRFAFTLMQPRADGRIAFHYQSRIVDAWLCWRGESFKWSLNAERLAAFLAAEGFKLCAQADADKLKLRYLHAADSSLLPLAEGEYICVAECD